MKEKREIEDKEKRCNRKDRGSLTVEALLFLIPFMCAFFTLINAARFVQAEMLIHHSITQTAKQISTYSYVLTKSKISEKMQNTNEKSEQFKTSVEGAISSIEGFADAFGDSNSQIDDVIDSGIEMGETMNGFLSDPGEIVSGVFSIAKSEGRKSVMTSAVGAIAKGNIKNSIGLISDDPNEFLENIGVVDGLYGLDFSESEWISNSGGKGDIRIVVTYKMKNFMFPEFDFGQYEFCQSASTLTW